MKAIKVRNIEIGAGKPKIIVPIVEKDIEAIVAQGTKLTKEKLDVVEWRVDFFEEVFDTEKVLAAAKGLRTALGEIPILFTFRTKKEGGEKEISLEAYTKLNKALAESGLVDLIDVEIFSGDAVVRENIANIHQAGAKVVGSNHDFFGTPTQADLVYRLRKMQDMGADIPKIAVMPKCKKDVLTLLSATEEMFTNYADRPIITMSMAGTGSISRLAGEAFGSAMTFGCVGKGSAPGQIGATDLSQALDIIHSAL